MQKILIVEDEHSIRSMYTYKLKLEEYDVYEAENGEKGLELVKKEHPDLILLDLKMPGLSGDEMLARLRETDWGANVRVVVLTNLNKNEAPASLRFLGVDRYVVKAHHTPAQVVDIVEEVLSKNGARKPE